MSFYISLFYNNLSMVLLAEKHGLIQNHPTSPGLTQHYRVLDSHFCNSEHSVMTPLRVGAWAKPLKFTGAPRPRNSVQNHHLYPTQNPLDLKVASNRRTDHCEWTRLRISVGPARIKKVLTWRGNRNLLGLA